ncbi:MAG: sigma-54-dependent Fis family transcriptional regulator, partial [Polyangiaceae bacterium]
MRFDEAETEVHESAGTKRAIRRRPRLDWRDAQGEHTAVIEKLTLVGSASRADIVVGDPTVSRLHAELEPRRDGLWIRDIGSRNGTYVEGVQVTVARVPDGGKFRLGAMVFTVNADPVEAHVELWPEERFGPLIGRSTAMRELFATIARIASMDATVLIQGETGTGKELVARALHEASPRAAHPLIVVDCAALSEQLLQAELFGHAKGAFTGADRSRAGAIESADGGTVFLDEIGEMPLSLQPNLLRVLESRTVRRLGETNHRPVEARFVSATHRDLRSMVNAGAFREDLYFRLAVLPITLPPLRARMEDIALLLENFFPALAASQR